MKYNKAVDSVKNQNTLKSVTVNSQNEKKKSKFTNHRTIGKMDSQRLIRRAV